MADTIEKTIYKLELDGSSYIAGVEKLSASTQKFSKDQEAANAELKKSEANLKTQSEFLARVKKDLDEYTGSNEKYRKQLQKDFDTASADNKALQAEVLKTKQTYDAATKAANDFAITAQKAANIQPIQGQGKIPAPGIPQNIGAGISSQIAGIINVADFAEKAQIVEQTKKEFDDLAISIKLAEERMKQLDATSEEFQLLEPIVKRGKEALQEYDKVTGAVVEKQSSLRSQIRLAKEELVKLEEAGLGTSKQYLDLEKKTAKLTDAFGDQQQRIKILASDTKLLDFGKASITAATSAFQAYTSVAILVGDESEELQKKTMQLFAAMQLLQSLEQLSNLTRREGALATLAQAGAQSIYTAVVGASTGALKSFRIALAATGIGAAVAVIGLLIAKYIEYKNSIKEVEEQQKSLNEINKEASKEVGKQIADLKILTQVAQDSNIPLKEREAAVKSLQKEFPDYFGNLSKEAILTGDITKQTEALTKSLIDAARARAAKGRIDQIESDKLDLEFQKAAVQAELDKAKVKQDAANAKDKRDAETRGLDQFNASAEVGRKLVEKKDIEDKEAALNRQEEFLTKFAGLNTLAKVVEEDDKKDEKAKKDVKEIQSNFEQRKAAILLEIARLAETEFQTKVSIEKVYALKLKKAIEDIRKDKTLKPAEPEKLIDLATTLNTTELEKALADFNKKVTDARKKLNDDLQSIQEKNALDQLNLIQDDFDRRRQLIAFNEARELQDAKENTADRLTALDAQRLLIGEEQYQAARAAIITAGEQTSLNITQRFANERKNLSADVFQSLLGAYQQAIANVDLILTQDEAAAIQSLGEKFTQGLISYDEFQKGIKDIEVKAERDRRARRIETEKNELTALDQQLATIEDKYSESYKKLQKQRDDLALKVAGEEIQQAKDVDPATVKQVESIQQYADAIGQVANSVVEFWRAANEAESKALDRSIRLQETRVTAAQRIADRGNAEYLAAEEDRLNELNVKRENAARKQLAIDAALQASQILVGITGAIAHIGTGTAAQTIGEIAVIIGALASGYGLVRSLQGNQPRLAEGTKYMKRGNNPSGVDTIPAYLNEGEAVIPTHRNKAYHPTVSAIYDGTVPADQLNSFVKNYHRIKSAPQLNHERIKAASELHIGNNGRMAVLLSDQNKKLDENNDLHRQTLRAMKNMSVSANIDKTGVAIMVNEYMNQMEIDKKL